MERKLAHLVSLIGINSVLDNIVANVIERISFDSSIFSCFHYKTFAKFVSTKSIKIDLFSPCSLDTRNPDIFELLEFGCRKWLLQLGTDETIKHPNSLKFVTSLRCKAPLVQNILSLKSYRLTTLEIIIDLTNRADIDMVCVAYDQLRSWCNDKDHGKRRNKLIVSINFTGYFKKETFGLQVAHMVTLMKLHKNANFDFEINPRRPSRPYPFAPCVYPLLAKNLIDKVALQTTGDTAGLKAVSFINGAIGLKNLSLELMESTGETTPVSFTISNPTVSCVHMCSNPGPQFDPCFARMPALKELGLYDCTVTVKCINSLPKSLAKLSLLDVDFCEFTENNYTPNCKWWWTDTTFSIKLPIHLRTLYLNGTPDRICFPRISNIKRLRKLADVSILIHDEENDDDVLVGGPYTFLLF
ncbi:unnamed protein product [Ambrosiozyma monospora]|uniref:Unnamed protein product n=1 Tax=Ambrosiozyma monospora TaxID=43982 RepID=A0A9W6YS99_AMBMO|nr:unnamed protein product [Ambrosiozyma monospora]